MPADMNDTAEWVHYEAPRTAKRKRAEAVCLLCHGKKIKCDLQVSDIRRFLRPLILSSAVKYFERR